MLYREGRSTTTRRWTPSARLRKWIRAVAPRASVEVIDTWRMAKDLKKARKEAAAALKKFPKDRMVKLVHASLLSDMGKTDEAVAELRALLDGREESRNTTGHRPGVRKGQALDRNGPGPGRRRADRPSPSRTNRQCCSCAAPCSKDRSSSTPPKPNFRKVLDLDPENAGALNYLGYMLADRNVRLDEAQKLVSKAVELDPQNGAYLDSLGWVCYRQNRLDEAADLSAEGVAEDRQGSDGPRSSGRRLLQAG